jgi:hypothetical protein
LGRTYPLRSRNILKKGDTGKDKEITVASWRKFYRLFRKTLEKNSIFANRLGDGEVRLRGNSRIFKKMTFMLLISQG